MTKNHTNHDAISPVGEPFLFCCFKQDTPPDSMAMLGAPEPMHDLYGTTGSVFASMYRHQLLAEMIPALSLPVGANHTSELYGQNYDMPIEFVEDGKWPRPREGGLLVWKHSDAKDVAYFYVNELFKKITEISNQ